MSDLPTATPTASSRCNPAEASSPLGLLLTSPHATNVEFLRRVRLLAEERLDRVTSRVAREMGYSSEQAETARLEFLRYFALRYLTRNDLEPSELADRFWHVFLLCTREYSRFCMQHFGGFVHHEPLETPSREAAGEMCQLYAECFGALCDMNPSSMGRPKAQLAVRSSRLRPHLMTFFEQDRVEMGRSSTAPAPSTERDSSVETSLFSKWGDWNNSWKNWGQWTQWDNWSQWEKGCCWA